MPTYQVTLTDAQVAGLQAEADARNERQGGTANSVETVLQGVVDRIGNRFAAQAQQQLNQTRLAKLAAAPDSVLAQVDAIALPAQGGLARGGATPALGRATRIN